jgi:hypothetical protein
MDIFNRISDGVHLDNNEYDQPENTMRDNRNGVIFDSVTGNYVWKNLKGTLSILTLSASDTVMKSCWIRNRYFLLILNEMSDYVQIKELTFATNGSVSAINTRWQSTNTLMGMDTAFPVRAMFGIYENEDIQRIYWSDFNNHPRCINIGNETTVNPNIKFIDFFPEITNDFGTIKLTSELTGGVLKAGTYFFAWRLYKEGYYTDWSYLSSPIPVFNGSVGSTYASYHAIEGGAPNEVTSKGLQLTLSNIDADYEKIQVASFYCNDYNLMAEGKIIYENTIAAATIVINYTGNENIGTVTISELMDTSILIEKVFDMIPAKKRNITANIEERSELDVSSLAGGKNNQMRVSITPNQFSILLDSTAYGYHSTPAYVKELYGIKTGALEVSTNKLFPYVYYYAVTETHIHNNGLGGQPRTIPAGTFFQAYIYDLWQSGTIKMAIVKKKYRKASATIPYNLNTHYSLETTLIENEYYNYKNPRFVEQLKGYPGGETVRFGVLFLDKTGRPFFVRHLYNTETTFNSMTIGPGDTRMPDRGENQGNFPIAASDGYVNVNPTYYSKTVGLVNYFKISGLDITPIKDSIGAFMIVRCPIERQNIAYGFLGMLNYSGNDIYVNKCFNNHQTNHYAGAYPFWCPEDLYDFSGFSIQPGDKLVNKYYLTPFYPQGTPQKGGGDYLTGMQGYGVESDSGNSGNFNLYQKFYLHENISTFTGNGAIGVEHEILSYKKYRQGDGDSIEFDPRDTTKLLRYRMHLNGYSGECATYLTNLGIAVLDINEATNNWKGVYNIPTDSSRMLICSVKRTNSNVYGGLSDSALASSVYQSTGHFQIINDTVLNEVKSGNNYIFNEIDVFGGDTYVCIWDVLRSMRNENLDLSRFSHAVLLPIETRINLDMREGHHVGKNRCEAQDIPDTTKLRWFVGYDVWEDFNYNDGYSSDNPTKFNLPLPNNFRLDNKFDTRIRFSNEKNYSEYEDSFRIFEPLNHFTLDTTFGPIINIRNKNNNIIYWQKNGVGYIPMGERALTSNDIGNAIQLGVSGIFERYDTLLEMIGNSNQHGLVVSDDGFHWYDGIRKLVVTLDNSLKLTQDSIVKGLDSYCINTIPNNMDVLDNPTHLFGILGGYDPKEKIVYISFKTNGFNETIGISIKSNKFVGFFDFRPRIYFNFRDDLYSIDNTFKTLYQHGAGTIGSYHGTTYDRSFTIIVKENSNEAKIFDTFEIIGNDKFFSTIDFTLEEGSTTKEYYSGANSRHLAKRLEYRNRRWFGNYPKISRERIGGGYVKIKFTDSGSSDLRFLQMKTIARQMI